MTTVNEQAPVFAFPSLVDLILCLLLCLFVNLLRLVRHCCLYVSESSTNKTRYRTSKKSKRVKTWNFVQTLIKQSNSSGNFPTGIVLLPPWCRCHLWNDGCCLNTRRGIILYHRLLACPRSNPWCLNCNLRKCDGKKQKRCWYVLSLYIFLPNLFSTLICLNHPVLPFSSAFVEIRSSQLISPPAWRCWVLNLPVIKMEVQSCILHSEDLSKHRKYH